MAVEQSSRLSPVGGSHSNAGIQSDLDLLLQESTHKYSNFGLMFTMPGMPAVPPHSQQIHHFPTLGLIFITIDHHPLLFKEINTYGMLEPFVIM